MMKKVISFLLLGTMLCFFTSSCFHQPVQLEPMPDPSRDMATTIIVFTAVAITATALTVLLSKHKPVLLTPEGKNVKLVMHEEAPEEAEYIGDIQTKVVKHLISIKNDLRNQAARMGGNLVVVDTFQSKIVRGRTWGYSGSGRVYYLDRNIKKN
jgi:hypothetical protein